MITNFFKDICKVMANIKSAKKRVLQIQRKTAINKNHRSRIRTFIRSVEEAISSGNKEKATDALKVSQSQIMHGVTKGIIHLNTASRKISRLSSRIKALS